MNIDELRHSLTEIADEARPERTTPVERIDAIEHKVRDHRRNTVVGTVAAAVVAIASVAGAPALLDDTGRSPQPADHEDNGLSTVREDGTEFYTQSAGSKLIGHTVAEPGATEVSFTFTPSTLNLSWEQECWDPQVKGRQKGVYTSYVNGHALGSSTCQGSPDPSPLNGTGSFGVSPAVNVKGWRDRGVRIGEPSTFTLKMDKNAEGAIDPQLVGGVWERGSQVESDGVWYDRQIIYTGHTYQVIAAKVAELDGTRAVSASIDLPRSDHPLYVYRGAQHVRHGLLFHDGTGLMQLGKGVPAGGSGDTVSPDRRTALVRVEPKNPDTTGEIFILVYERID